MRRTIGSAASGRAFQASQSLFDLAPDPAHDVLAHGPAEQRNQSAPHPPRIGAGEVGAGNQRIGGERATLIGPQRLAVPFGGPAIGSLQPGARYGDLGFAKAAGQRARAAAVTMANNTCRTGVFLLCPPIASASQRRIQLTADERLDELANPFAHTALDRIKPVVEKVGGGVGCRLERIRLRGTVRHGVVSVPALERRVIRG
jgi:hypothetical protein